MTLEKNVSTPQRSEYKYLKSSSENVASSCKDVAKTSASPVKKQQMQWTQEGAHYMLQTRTAVLNNELQDDFSRWYPGICISHSKKHEVLKMKKAA